MMLDTQEFILPQDLTERYLLPEVSQYRLQYAGREEGLSRHFIDCLDNDKRVGMVFLEQLVEFPFELPADLTLLIESCKKDGIETYVSSVYVEDDYRGKGIGSDLLLIGLYKLISTNKEFNHLVRDSSFGWASERALPYVRTRMGSGGYSSSEVWSGIMTFRGSKQKGNLINYSSFMT